MLVLSAPIAQQQLNSQHPLHVHHSVHVRDLRLHRDRSDGVWHAIPRASRAGLQGYGAAQHGWLPFRRQGHHIGGALSRADDRGEGGLRVRVRVRVRVRPRTTRALPSSWSRRTATNANPEPYLLVVDSHSSLTSRDPPSPFLPLPFSPFLLLSRRSSSRLSECYQTRKNSQRRPV